MGRNSSHLMAQAEGSHWGPLRWDKLQRKWAGGVTISSATTVLGGDRNPLLKRDR